ncbi:MAG TPA: glycosyltransferase family 2 protein [Pirellulales bacterium]|nr:glycosyltransferase family 2 protein [Pirellulales bacterium]
MPRLSIIIPSQGDWQSLETTLVSVLQNRPPHCEVVVVLDQGYDDPYELREEVRFIEAPRRARMVDLINAGFVAARAELLHVVACGATIDEGWTEPALRNFDDPQIAAVAPLVLDAACPTHVVSAGCLWSAGGELCRFASGLRADTLSGPGRNWVGPDCVAAFYRRSALAEVASLDATLPAELAAIDLSLRLAESGRRSVLELGSRLAVERTLLAPARHLSDGWHSERLFWRYAAQRGRLRKLAAHAGLLSSELLFAVVRPTRLARTLGRLIGTCDRRQAQTTSLPREPAHCRPLCDHDRRVDQAHGSCTSERGAGTRRSPVSLSATEKTS